MKVGTDAVLLGAWVNTRHARAILDVGTGSGVIALMLAQRTAHEGAAIDAIEIEPADAAQAAGNARHSPWAGRIRVYPTAIQAFHPDRLYDLIVSNPPFFINSQTPPSDRRTQTRHTTTLDHPTLLGEVNRLLAPQGSFNVILPFTEGTQFIHLAEKAGLINSRQFAFRTRREKPIERWLLEFTRQARPYEKGEILLYDNGLTWSARYQELTGDFYLQK